MKRNLVILASYPKSGNTWLRMLLQNLKFGTEDAEKINNLKNYSISDDRPHLFEQYFARDVEDLTTQECMAARSDLFGWLSDAALDDVFIKTHSVYGRANGHQLFQPDAIRKVIHVVRHPLDVVPSKARHYGISIEQAAQDLFNKSSTTHFKDRLPVFISSWGFHTRSWLESVTDLDVLTLTYEHMLADTPLAAATISRHLGLEISEDRILKAVHASSFDVLKAQELADGFNEQSDHNPEFFYRGVTGEGAQVLSTKDQDRIQTIYGDLYAEVSEISAKNLSLNPVLSS